MFLIHSSIVVIVGNLILNLVSYSESHLNCGALTRSSCTDSITTKWNKNSVGEHLKNWISSISKIRSMPDREKEHFFLRKTVLVFETKNKRGGVTGEGVRYIANRDCSRKMHVGPIWRKTSIFSNTQFHDGFLYGIEDDNGELTGNDVVFIYPDLETVLVGQFEKGQMVTAKQSKIVGERCNRGIKEIRIAKPKDDKPYFKYQRPDRLRIGDQPRVMDPYTKTNIYIGGRKKDDGVFAKRNIAKGELVMYYSGLFCNTTEQALYTMNMYHNQTWEEYWDIFRNLMQFDGPVKIHIPEPYWSISNFRATLGHKVNHSFKYAKTAYGKVFHPRFGNIRSVYALTNITKGEEILVNYGYRVGGNVPKWISELYLKETGKEWYGENKSNGRQRRCSK